MKKSDQKKIEERLREERERVLRLLRKLEEEEKAPPGELAGEISHYHMHLADEASNTDEQERDFLMAQLKSDTLRQIDDALQLLIRDPAQFERCESCGNKIEIERLEVIPWTRLCAQCARQADSPA